MIAAVIALSMLVGICVLNVVEKRRPCQAAPVKERVTLTHIRIG